VASAKVRFINALNNNNNNRPLIPSVQRNTERWGVTVERFMGTGIPPNMTRFSPEASQARSAKGV